MPDDLADRISDGVVAVLELVPGEKRFVDLSRHVLKGGAERFRPIVLTDEPVRYLVPVGVPGKKLDFGTLLVQRSRVALVWRSDPARPYHAVVCDLNRRTTVSQTAVVVRGETWGRFDMRDEMLACRELELCGPVDAESVAENIGTRVVIRSDNDTLVPAAAGDALAERLGAEVLVVPGAGHFLEVDGMTSLTVVLDALVGRGSDR